MIKALKYLEDKNQAKFEKMAIIRRKEQIKFLKLSCDATVKDVEMIE